MAGSVEELSSPAGARSSRPLELSLLGPLRVVRDADELEVPTGKLRLLLLYLALHVGTPVGRDQLVEALWPQRDPERGVATMRVHVSRLRDLLEPDRSGAPRVLRTHGSSYVLERAQVELDLDRFERLTTEGHRIRDEDPHRAAALLEEALASWRGRPLQDVEYEEFAQGTIRRLERLRLDAILDRSEALLAVGDAATAFDAVEPLAHDDPVAQRPAALVVRSLYQLGRQHEALRRARRHEQACVEQGLDPSPAFGALVRQVLRHDRELTPAPAVHHTAGDPAPSVRGYELRERRGAGPTGTVHRAYQRSVGREVAVKIIHPALAAEPEFAKGFAQEVRRTAAQRHANLVPVLDAWRDATGAYVVTPWFEGGSFAAPAQELTVAGVGSAAAGLAGALACLHEAGLTHGAVSATNVLLDGRGGAYLADVRLPSLAPPGGTRASETADVVALGELLAAVLGRLRDDGTDRERRTTLEAVVRTATAPDAAARFPDAAALRLALLAVADPATATAVRRDRRNPYKGLAPFTEADHLDLHGRDDAIAALVEAVGRRTFTAVIGASGSGKSSVVSAGLLPRLRRGAVPGSAGWSIVTMVPGPDPFVALEAALAEVAVTPSALPALDGPGDGLLDAVTAALPSPSAGALLVVDQLEELFGAAVDDEARTRFLDGLVALARDPRRRVRLLAVLRADLTGRALAHPGLGRLLAEGSYVLAPVGSDQVAEVIRGPAVRAGVHVTPELVAELTREVSTTVTPLPLLQYVLSELFERRDTDTLSLAAYREVGQLEGVLERRAERTYRELRTDARHAARRFFLRLVTVDDEGVVTRRRLNATELPALGARADVDAVVAAFGAARLLTHDRDPISRTPTIELAHEVVIRAWPTLRGWVDEAREDLIARRRVAAAAAAWREADEDPAFLLQGGPLVAATALAASGRVALDVASSRYVQASRHAAEVAAEREAAARQDRAQLERTARRRLRVGAAGVALTVLITVVAAFAWSERGRAERLAALRADESLARELAAASASARSSADPDLAILLATEAAERSLAAGREVLPEVVDALHHALITPRPDLVIEGAATAGGGQLLALDRSGRRIVVLAADRGVSVRSIWHGGEVGRIEPVDPPAFALDLHPDGRHVLTVHADGVREWDWLRGDLVRKLEHPVETSTAAYAPDGSLVAVGDSAGGVRVWRGAEVVADLDAHDGPVTSVTLDPGATRVATAGGAEGTADVLVWDIASGEVVTQPASERLLMPAYQVRWHPRAEAIGVSTRQGEVYLLDATTGERLFSYGNGQVFARAIGFDGAGRHLVASGTDGIGRVYATWVGGEAVVELPTGGVPLLDLASHPSLPTGVSVGADGLVRVWNDLDGSELPARWTDSLYPRIAASAAGDRYLLAAPGGRHELPDGWTPTTEVIDAATGATLVSRPSLRRWEPRQPALSSSGALAAFAGADGDVELVQVDDGGVTVLPDSAAWARALAFSPDERVLAGAGSDGTVKVWSTDDGALAEVVRAHPPGARTERTWAVGSAAAVHHLAFTSDETLVSAGADGTVRRSRLGTDAGAVLHSFDHEALSVAAHPATDRVAAADATGRVVLVDVEDATVHDLEAVDGRTELTFDPDGRWLVGAGPGGVAHLWDTTSQQPLRRVHGAIYPPTSAGFLDGGRELRVAGGDGVVRGYLLDPRALVELARGEVSRELTDEECRRFLRDRCELVSGSGASAASSAGLRRALRVG